MKTRITSRIAPDIHDRLIAAANRPGITQSQIIEAALAGFLSPELDDQRDAAILRRLDRMTRQFGRVERDQMILAETLALFIRLFLTLMPPMPEADKAAARAKGNERFEFFLKRLGRQLASGRRVLEEALEEVIPKAEEFFSVEDVEKEREATGV